MAHPSGDLDRSGAFYRDLLGLRPTGGFADHDGYDGIFFGLPGGGELELTAGPATPRPGSDEDLLVLYVPTLDDVRETAAELEAAGVPTVPAANPYWNRWGRVFLDPDGYAIVIAATPPNPVTAGVVRVETYDGPREELRGLFELAEDSAAELDSYLHAGRVLTATVGLDVVGHLQLVETDRPGQTEIKNMAVRQDWQGGGIGVRLVRAALDLLAAEGGWRCSWPPRPQTSATSASTSGRGSGCAPSNGTRSLPPRDTRQGPGSTVSSFGTGCGWTVRSIRPRSAATDRRSPGSTVHVDHSNQRPPEQRLGRRPSLAKTP